MNGPEPAGPEPRPTDLSCTEPRPNEPSSVDPARTKRLGAANPIRHTSPEPGTRCRPVDGSPHPLRGHPVIAKLIGAGWLVAGFGVGRSAKDTAELQSH